MEQNNNEQVIIEVKEKKRTLKEKAKDFVQKHKSKLIGGALIAGTAVVTAVVCKLTNKPDEDEEDDKHEVYAALTTHDNVSYEEYDQEPEEVETEETEEV